MFPVLFSLGPFTFYTFNLFLILGFLLALYFIWRKVGEEVEDEEKIFDILFLVLIFGLLGGRLVEGILSWQAFGFSIYRLLAFWAYPGFSAWGAFLVAIIALFWICRKKPLNFFKIFDYLVFGLAFFLPFVFLGHFFAGSYFGSQTDFFWGVFVPGLLGRRHPTAIIGFFASLLFLFAVYRLGSKKHFPGATALLFFVLFSFFSFAIEWLRGDSLYLERRTANLIFSAVAFVVSASLFYLKSKRNIGQDLKLVAAFLAQSTFKVAMLASRFRKLLTERK